MMNEHSGDSERTVTLENGGWRLGELSGPVAGSMLRPVHRRRRFGDSAGASGPGSALGLAGLDGRAEQEPVAPLAQVERILGRFGLEAEMDPPGFKTFQMDAKNETMTRYDQQFRWIAGCLESLYHLAGQHELAARVKPSTRRPGRTQADVEEEAKEPDGSGEEPETDGSEAAS